MSELRGWVCAEFRYTARGILPRRQLHPVATWSCGHAHRTPEGAELCAEFNIHSHPELEVCELNQYNAHDYRINTGGSPCPK